MEPYFSDKFKNVTSKVSKFFQQPPTFTGLISGINKGNLQHRDVPEVLTEKQMKKKKMKEEQKQPTNGKSKLKPRNADDEFLVINAGVDAFMESQKKPLIPP